MIYAPSFPLQLDDTYGFKNVDDARELIRFHLINLLFTDPGEKISNPNFGVGIRRYLFENFNNQLLPNIEIKIENQIKAYLNYLQLREVIVYEDLDNSNVLGIRIVYSIEGIPEEQILNLNINIGEGILLDNQYY